MEKQLIISVGREYGSGGHYIATKLAEKFCLPLYDRNLLDEIAIKKNVNAENLAKYDEIPRKVLFSRTVRGFNSSPEENIAMMQFDFLREKAQAGESFVVVGRCSEYILREYDCLIPIFILGDYDYKLKRIQTVRNFSEKEAASAIKRHDRRRKAYHNFYCDIRWGDSRAYDICINSSRLGEDKTAELLETYIKEKTK